MAVPILDRAYVLRSVEEAPCPNPSPLWNNSAIPCCNKS